MSWLYNRILDTLAFGAVLLLFAITVGIGIDVAARYAFSSPIPWMSEFVQHSMLLILFLSIGWLTRERGHVAIEILLDALPRRSRRWMEILAALLSCAIAGFVGTWAAITSWDNYNRNVLTDGIFPIPRHWLLGVITLGLLLTAIEFMRMAVTMLIHPELEIRQADAEIEAVAPRHSPKAEPRDPV